MKLRAHCVMVVASHSANYRDSVRSQIEGVRVPTQRPVLPIPYPDRLIIRTGQNPRQLVMEKDGAYVVEVAIQREETSPCLIRPNFDLVVIPTRNEQRLCLMEIDPSHWAIVLFEPFYKCAHAIVP